MKLTPPRSRCDLDKLRLAALGVGLDKLVRPALRVRLHAAAGDRVRGISDTAGVWMRVLPLRQIRILLLRDRDACAVPLVSMRMHRVRRRRRRFAAAELRLHVLLRRQVRILRRGRHRLRASWRRIEAGRVCVLRVWYRMWKCSWYGCPRDGLSLGHGGWRHISWTLALRDRRPVRRQRRSLCTAAVSRRKVGRLRMRELRRLRIGEAFRFGVAGKAARHQMLRRSPLLRRRGPPLR